MIELVDIRKSYVSDQPVLDGISMSLAGGHFYALLGRNGAGKSTLMKILMRTIAPDSGDGRVLGIGLSENSAAFNAHIGFASETVDYAIPYRMQELFSNFRRLYPNWDEALFEKIAADLKLDLRKRFGALSRGQRMQAAAAVALSIRPKVLLLDEITSVLDAGARSYFMNAFSEFVRAGGTVVMATNIVSEVHHIADWLIFLEGGKIKFLASAADVSAKFRRLRRSRGVRHPIFENPECVETRIDEDDHVLYIAPLDVTQRYALDPDMVDPRKVTAEEVFIYFTKGHHP